VLQKWEILNVKKGKFFEGKILGWIFEYGNWGEFFEDGNFKNINSGEKILRVQILEGKFLECKLWKENVQACKIFEYEKF
jgi:hypothetical protein